MLPMLGSFLVGVAAKIGASLVPAGREPATPTRAAARGSAGSFARELARAQRQTAPAAPPAGTDVRRPPIVARGRAIRRPQARPSVEPPPLSSDPAQLALAARGPARRRSPALLRGRRSGLAAYRRLDIGSR
jgi:hypothetical protein